MTRLSTELKNSALRILKDFGERGTLRRVTHGAYDPDTGKPSKTTVDHDVTIVVVQFKKGETETGLVSKDERKAYVEVRPGVVPQHEDLLVFAGQTVKVTRVMSVLEGSAGSLLYVLSVRG